MTSNFDRTELIVDGRGGIRTPADAIDPFEHVAHLEELLGHPLCSIEITETTTVTTTTVKRRVITINRTEIPK